MYTTIGSLYNIFSIEDFSNSIPNITIGTPNGRSFLLYGLLYHRFEVCIAYLQCLPESNVLKVADISSLVKARVLNAQPLLLEKHAMSFRAKTKVLQASLRAIEAGQKDEEPGVDLMTATQLDAALAHELAVQMEASHQMEDEGMEDMSDF
jgi:hypothetical protein